VLVPAGLALLAAGGTAFLLPQRYGASVRLRAEWERQGEGISPGWMADESSRRLQEVRSRVLNRAAIERVIREEAPYTQAGREALPLPAQVEALLDAVKVERGDAGTFVIGYVHRDPGKAALVPNRLAALLVEDAERQRVELASADPAVLRRQLEEARASVEERQAALRSPRSVNSGGSPLESAREPAPQETLEAEQQAIALELSAALDRAEKLRGAIELEKPPAAASQTSVELAALRAQRAELRKRYTEEHPDVEALTRRIRRLEMAPAGAEPTPAPQASSLQAELAQIEGEIETLRQKETSVESERARLTASRPVRRPRSGPSPGPGQDIRALTRDYEQARDAFLALQDAWTAAETASRLRQGHAIGFRILEPARASAAPLVPNPLLLILPALALGLAVGLVAAVRGELRDPSVKNPEDLEETLEQPLLAVIPEVRVRSRKS
jgi:polysaccharide biosynthesis transport protein